jgi:hypothetical protein
MGFSSTPRGFEKTPIKSVVFFEKVSIRFLLFMEVKKD